MDGDPKETPKRTYRALDRPDGLPADFSAREMQWCQAIAIMAEGIPDGELHNHFTKIIDGEVVQVVLRRRV